MTVAYYVPGSLMHRAVELLRPHTDLSEVAVTRLLLTICRDKRQMMYLRNEMQKRGVMIKTINLTPAARAAQVRQ